jgi:hypothetical protein
MATGSNHRVDNFHAGGIAAAIDIDSGVLGSASNLGMDAHLGWLDQHPDTNAPIRGRLVPQWAEACDLARRAHRAFDDRVVIGWDIGLTADGPVVVEGNSRPDVDILQRMARGGLAEGRLGQLLLHHVSGPSAIAEAPAAP